MKFLRSAYSDWVIGLLITLPLVAAFLFDWSPLQTLEYKTYDFRAKLRQRGHSSPVVIVAIDDGSIATLGRWPWPRSYMADMIMRLSYYDAKSIGVNVLYSEPDRNAGLGEIKKIRRGLEENPKLEKSAELMDVYQVLSEAEERLDSDLMLSMSIEESGRVVLPMVFSLGESVGKGELPDYLMKNSFPADSGVHVSATAVTPPIVEFAGPAQALGHVNLLEDQDGTIRKEPLFVEHRERLFPSFALQVAMNYLGYGVSDIRVSDSVGVGKIDIPTDAMKKMLISYVGGQASFPYYSFYDVATEKIPPDVFEDKIVLIGHTATGLSSLAVTPLQHAFPTIEVSANVIENILDRNFIHRPGWAWKAELGAIAFFGIFVSFIMPRFRAGLSAFFATVMLLLWNGAAVYLFTSRGLWLQAFLPTLVLGLGYTVIVSKRYLVTERMKEVVEADSIETNKMLGLSFQGQGMLDMAFEKFRRCPIEEESVKELLYNLGLDFERKRQFNKAAAVFEHIGRAGKYKDIAERIGQLKAAGETMIFGAAQAKKDSTMLVQGSTSKPTLGRYEVLKELGRGAMGTVYLGKDPKINRMVAIKTVRFDEVEEDQVAEVKQRFFREAEAAGTLSHPNIVTIYDAGEDYDLAYVAMELLEGTDLTKYCAKGKLFPPKAVMKVIAFVADALDYAHARGVVHRDIKPANIMLLKTNVIKVTDFGIARVVATSRTQTGVILGTPSYMSPEQVLGKKVDGRSDLFSLGVMSYEMLTAEKPFGGDSIATLMFNIANQPHPPLKQTLPDLPDCCIEILDRMLAKEAEKRYQRGAEIVADIKTCLKGTA